MRALGLCDIIYFVCAVRRVDELSISLESKQTLASQTRIDISFSTESIEVGRGSCM
jgi:hypothetical protein